MNQKQLKALIAAGVFSSAMIAGNVYAGDSTDGTPKKSASKKHMKGHDCAGKNSCKGKGGCKTSDGGCAGKNSCKGKGGCKTGEFKKAEAPAATGASATSNATAAEHSCKGQNSCKGKGGCKTSDAGCKGKNSCAGKGGCSGK